MRKKKWAQLLSVTLTVSCVFTGGGAASASAQAGQDAGPFTVEEEYGEFFSTEEGQPEQTNFYGLEPEESFFDIEADQPEQADINELKPQEESFFDAKEEQTEQADFSESEPEEESFFDIEADEETDPEDSDIFQGNPEDAGELFLSGDEELLTAADGSVPLDEAHFPDWNFLWSISNEYDANWDDILSAEEICRITKLDVSYKDISSLKGIEYFTELEDLDCSCDSLTELDVSRNTKLKTLNCGGNHLTYLNLEGIPLTHLTCNELDDADEGIIEAEAQSRHVEINPSAPQVSLADLAGRENLGRITLDEKYEMDESGVVSFAKFWPDAPPHSLSYEYDTGFNGIKMFVSIFLDIPSSYHSTMDNALPMELEQEYIIAHGYLSYFLEFCPQEKEKYYLQMDSLEYVTLYHYSDFSDDGHEQVIRGDGSEESRTIYTGPGDVFYIEVNTLFIETTGTLSILNYKKYLTEKYEARENLPVFQNTDLTVTEKELRLKDCMDDQGDIPLKIIPTRTGRYLLTTSLNDYSYDDVYYDVYGEYWDLDYQDAERNGYAGFVYLEKGRTYYARLLRSSSFEADKSAIVKLFLICTEDVVYGTEGALSRTVLYKGLDCDEYSYRFPEIYLKGSLEGCGNRVMNDVSFAYDIHNNSMPNGDSVQWMLTANGTSSELPSQTGTYQAQFVVTTLTQKQTVIDVDTVELADQTELPLVKGSGTVQPAINFWGDAFFRLQTGTATQYSIHNPYYELYQNLGNESNFNIAIYDKEIPYPYSQGDLVQYGEGADPVFTLAPNTTYYVRVYHFPTNDREHIPASMNVTVKALGKKSLKDCTVTVASSAPYTGKAVTPTVKVKDGSVTLKKDTDYTLKFTNNKNPGTATVTVTGKGNYEGTVTKSFKIYKPIKNCTITVASSVSYTGKAITPTVKVKDGSATLKKNTDYTLKFTNNTNPGTATVTVTGKGTYGGTVTKSFRIIKSLKKCTITVASSASYTGKAVTPTVKVKDGSTTLKKNTDYTLKFVNNKNLGTATVTVTGKGNYKEAVKKTFKIVLAVPKLVSVKSAGYNSLKVTWGKVTGADSYNLYYQKAGAKKWTLVKSGIKAVSYTHTSSKLLTGTKYAYTVKAVKGRSTSDCDKKNGLSAAPSLAAGKLTKVAKASNGLKLTWSKVTGASGYVIERMQNGKWVTKKTISGGSKVSFVDTTAAKGKTFRYRIRAFRTVNGKKVYGAYSAAKEGKR